LIDFIDFNSGLLNSLKRLMINVCNLILCRLGHVINIFTCIVLV